MKKQFLQIISLVLSLIILLPFAGCVKDEPVRPVLPKEDRVVLSFRGETITESEFGYYLSLYKGRFSRAYADFSDTDEFYSSEFGSTTMEDYLLDTVVQNVKRTLISEALYSEQGFDDADLIAEDIGYYIESLVYERYGNDREAFSKALAAIGITEEQLKQIYIRDEMTYSLFSYLAGEKATIGLNDSAKQEYLEKNYARIRHIYVNNKYTYLTDESGAPVYGPDGKQQTAPLTGEDLAAKNALISAIDESLGDGGDFDEIYSALSEDKYYENGYYLTRNTEFIDTVVSAAFNLEVGEWVKLTSNVGTHYVMRLPMDQSPWENNDNADFFGDFNDAVLNELFGEYLDSFSDEVSVNKDVLDDFDIRSAKINYNF